MKRVKLSLVFLMLVMIGSGCGPGNRVRYVYSGPKKSLKDVAVLLNGANLLVEWIDGGSFYEVDVGDYVLMKPVRGGHEYHLLPGKHSITGSYFEYLGNEIRSGERLHVVHDFRAGHVYELYPEVFVDENRANPPRKFLGIFPIGSSTRSYYTLHIRHLGTVEEFVAKEKNLPEHWYESPGAN